MNTTDLRVAMITAGGKSLSPPTRESASELCKTCVSRHKNVVHASVSVADSKKKTRGFSNMVTVLVLLNPSDGDPVIRCRLYFSGAVHLTGAKTTGAVRDAVDVLNECGLEVRDVSIFMITASFRIVDTHVDLYGLARVWQSVCPGGAVKYDPDRHAAARLTFAADGDAVAMVFRTGVITLTGRIRGMEELSMAKESVERLLAKAGTLMTRQSVQEEQQQQL